jgi:hypothetical protein
MYFYEDKVCVSYCTGMFRGSTCRSEYKSELYTMYQ